MILFPLALYGKAYIPAAKDTWRLFKDRGIDALVNDSLVGMSKSSSLRVARDTLLTGVLESADVGCLRDWTSLLPLLLPLPQM